MLDITVKTLDSQNHSFTCEDDITVQGFKEHIADTVSVPVESQRLIYCGRVLQDDKKLNDYDVNGKVIHLVQRAPPQPASRSSSSDRQRSTNQGWTLGSPRVQLSRGLHRNVYMGAMAVPTEVVENHGLPAPRLSNTLSNSRLVTARSMLNKVSQLLDRMDDPTVPLHPNPTENSSSESTEQPQPSAPEEEQLFQGNLSGSWLQVDASRESAVQAAQQIADAFTAAALINIRVSDGNNEERTSGGSNSESETSQSNQSTQSQTQQEPLPHDGQNLLDSEQQRQETERPETETSEGERPDTSRTSNDTDDQNGASRRSAPVPRPPLMAELLDNLLSTQDRMRPYIERYRTLMSTDPALTATSGPESVAENQRIVDGVSETLHYLSHASHALSDIIVDMGQQPPRNLRCRPIIIQHSTILQAGIPIQVESHINLNRSSAPSNNNASDEGNEATRPASPVHSPARTQQQATRSNNTSSQSSSPNANSHQGHASLLGTLLLPSNVEVSMELSPPTAMDFNSPSATEGSENDQGQNINNNNNSNGLLGAAGNSLNRTPLALIREALRSVINESQAQAETSASTSINLPFVMDLGTPNSGQSTQARSNIDTHPTTSTQTRSTARPHVLHPQSSPLNMGMGMGHNLDFDPFLPCYSHHVRRTPNSANSGSTSASRSNRRNPSSASAGHSRSQSASRSSSASARTMPHVNFTVGGEVTSDFLENDSQLASGVGLAMTLGEIFQGATNSGDVHISLIGGPNTSEIHLTPSNDIPLLELLRTFNVRAEELVDRSFLSELCLFLLRKLTVSNILQLGLGQLEPVVSLRRPLREFLEQSFPNESGLSLQKKIVDQVIEQIISSHQPYIQILVSSQAETAGRRVDIPATIEALLRTALGDFIKALFCNDSDDAHYAERVKLIARRFEEQSSAVLQHILGGRTALESVVTQVFNRVTESTNPFFRQFMADMISARLRSFTSQSWTRPQEELSPLIVFVDETPTTSVSESAESQRKPETEPQFRAPSTQCRNVSAQPTQSRSQKPQQKQGPSVKQEKESESTPMEVDKTELDLELSNVVESDPKDLANGEEIQESFPGSENLPSEWVPIIARDTVRQRRQVQVQNLQGGPIPFSDAYLSCMPSKRRKLIEQQKPQLLVTPTPANANAIAASVERLVRDGMVHSQVEEVEGAAHAVAAAPEVRTAFGQAIRDCLHPSRVQSQDFSNSRRFPNASRYFGSDGKDDSADTTNGFNK